MRRKCREMPVMNVATLDGAFRPSSLFESAKVVMLPAFPMSVVAIIPYTHT